MTAAQEKAGVLAVMDSHIMDCERDLTNAESEFGRGLFEECLNEAREARDTVAKLLAVSQRIVDGHPDLARVHGLTEAVWLANGGRQS